MSDAAKRMGLGVCFPEVTECAGGSGGWVCSGCGAGLLVGGDVSVSFSLGRLPRGGGVWWVRDRGYAMCQGS